MTERHLPQLDGTQYTATVYRDSIYALNVRVTRPAYAGPGEEVIGDRYLGENPTSEDRDRVIAEIINTDTADLVGVYTGEKENE